MYMYFYYRNTSSVFFWSEMRWWGVILASEAVIASIITGKRHWNKQQSLCFELTFMNIYSCYYCRPLHIIHLCFHLSYYCKSLFWKIFPRALFLMLFYNLYSFLLNILGKKSVDFCEHIISEYNKLIQIIKQLLLGLLPSDCKKFI